MSLVVCPGCGESHSDSRLEDERGFARCPDCHAVFVIPKSVVTTSEAPLFRSDRIEAPSELLEDTREVPRRANRPSGGYRSPGDRNPGGADLTMTWRYRHHSPGLVLFLGLTMTLLTVLWVFVGLDKQLSLYLIIGFGAPFGMLAVGFGYSFAVATMDWMKLSLTGGILKISAGPLPMPKATVRLSAKEIQDVYVRKTVVVSPSSSADPTVNAVYFELRVFLESGIGHRLTQFRDVEMALYIAQCLNESLGLPPGPSERLHEKMQSFRDLYRDKRELSTAS